MKECIFVSSVQKELAGERKAVRDFVKGDPLLSSFFDVFLFEDLPASDQRADSAYLSELRRSRIYLGIFGNEYGIEDNRGLSPTHREFLAASVAGKTRLIYVKGTNDRLRHPKIKSLLCLAGGELIRRRFDTIPELQSAVYASLVKYLHDTGRLLTRPFDATAARNATLKDISTEKVRWFLARARNERDYPLSQNTSVKAALAHLNLLENERPNNAAILAFGLSPQRFLTTSEVKCMHFHSLQKQKPIPSYQIFKGTIFDLVDQSVDFVMSKLNRSVGTRAMGPQAPVEYDIPQEVVAEGIVNAIAHRNYVSNASVEIMLFPDRLEIWNPGSLPPSLSIKGLRKPHSSQPGNPLLAEPLFLTKYIEKAGSGIIDMYAYCRAAEMKPPRFQVENGFFILTVWRKHSETVPVREKRPTQSPTQSPTQLSDPIYRLLSAVVTRPLSSGELRPLLAIKHRPTFRENYLRPALKKGLIAYTVPKKTGSRLQKYRITGRGRIWLAKQR